MRLALLHDFGYAAHELFVAESEAVWSEYVEDNIGVRGAGNDVQIVDGQARVYASNILHYPSAQIADGRVRSDDGVVMQDEKDVFLFAKRLFYVVDDVNGIELFIQAIPFNFYSLLMIVFVIGLIFLNFDYGPMAKAELEAYRDGRLGSLEEEKPVGNPKASLWDMLLPIIVLIVCCIGAMLYVGGFFGGDANGNVIEAFGNTDAFAALPWGSLIAVTFTFLYLIARRVLNLKTASEAFVAGFNAMVPAILVLTFAVTLKNMTSLLGADVFVAGLVEGAAPGLFNLLPAVIFLVAVFLGFSTGTSWGTFGILIPIVMPIFANDPTLLIIGISACLAGAVAGDHCSPISDTTVMSSAGANMLHVEHVSTQLPYVITMACVSFVMFVIAGFVQNAFICLPLGAALTIGVLIVLKKKIGKSVKDLEPFNKEAAEA